MRKPIKGHPDYFIYDDGRVWSEKAHGQFLQPHINAKGYLYVKLSTKGTKKTYKIHRLVAEHFCVGDGPDMQVCHNDSNKLNNLASNLRFDTQAGNNADKSKRGTAPRDLVMEGRHPGQVLTPDEVSQIVQMLRDKQTNAAVGRAFGVGKKTITSINVGRSWAYYTRDVLGHTFPIRKRSST